MWLANCGQTSRKSEPAVLARRLLVVGAEIVVGPVAAGEADDGAFAGEVTAPGQVIRRGHELAMSQVARCAEEHDRTGFGHPGSRQCLTQRVGFRARWLAPASLILRPGRSHGSSVIEPPSICKKRILELSGFYESRVPSIKGLEPHACRDGKTPEAWRANPQTTCALAQALGHGFGVGCQFHGLGAADDTGLVEFQQVLLKLLHTSLAATQIAAQVGPAVLQDAPGRVLAAAEDLDGRAAACRLLSRPVSGRSHQSWPRQAGP